MVSRYTPRTRSAPSRLALGLISFFVVLSVIMLRDSAHKIEQPSRIRHYPTRPGYNWETHPQRYPVAAADTASLPEGLPLALPKVQHDFAAHQPSDLKRQLSSVNLQRQQAVKAAAKGAWATYTQHAWGRDELHPISLRGADPFNGWGATIVDSLDTLWMMGMDHEFRKGVEFVATIDWNNSTQPHCNLFETTIRYIGGLLGAFDLSHEPVLLMKATELADLLYAAFDTPNRFPPFIFRFDNLKAGKVETGAFQSAAAIGSLSLEFTRLAQLTGHNKYYDAVDRITRAFAEAQGSTLLPGLWPNFINVRDGFRAPGNVFRLGADGDSLYEYLPKMHALLGGLDPVYDKMYRRAAAATRNNLLFRPMTPRQDDVLLIGTAVVDTSSGTVTQIAEMEHLTCFAGGMFALAGRLLSMETDVQIGEKIARGCAWLYSSTKTGLMPEKSHLIRCPSAESCPWDESQWLQHQAPGKPPAPRGLWRVEDSRYLLRPEAIESLFVLYRVTGKTDLQDLAWEMFQAVEKATRMGEAFAAVADVTVPSPGHIDGMESFFLAETLKYFYLIFSNPEFMSLDEWVFNTEAHPFRRSLPDDGKA